MRGCTRQSWSDHASSWRSLRHWPSTRAHPCRLRCHPYPNAAMPQRRNDSQGTVPALSWPPPAHNPCTTTPPPLPLLRAAPLDLAIARPPACTIAKRLGGKLANSRACRASVQLSQRESTSQSHELPPTCLSPCPHTPHKSLCLLERGCASIPLLGAVLSLLRRHGRCSRQLLLHWSAL